jgi:hypothetical protein
MRPPVIGASALKQAVGARRAPSEVAPQVSKRDAMRKDSIIDAFANTAGLIRFHLRHG